MSRTSDKGQVKAVSFRYKWELDNSCLECCKVLGDSLESPVFTTTTTNIISETLKWRLRLYPKGKRDYEEFVSLYLVSCNEANVQVHYTFTLVDKSKQTIILRVGGDKVYNYRYNIGHGEGEFFRQDLKIHKKSGCLLGDNLTIVCDLTVDSATSKAEIKYSKKRCLEELEYLENLMESQKFSDVTLKVSDQIFYAHKCILTSRSPVFEAMFAHEMKEKIDNVVDIEDVDHEVFREMLRFMYAGKVNNIEIHAYKLLAVADRYSIQGLKNLCEESIGEDLTLGNAVRYLKYADDCNAAGLKRQVLDFIAFNSEKMLDIPEYQSLENMPSKLVFEVVRALSFKEN